MRHTRSLILLALFITLAACSPATTVDNTPTLTATVLPSPTFPPTEIPILSIEERLQASEVITLDNNALYDLVELKDEDALFIFERFRSKISRNDAWNNRKISDFDLTTLIYKTSEGLTESLLLATLADQTFVIGRSLKDTPTPAINLPLLSEPTEAGKSYYFITTDGSRYDLIRDEKQDGKIGVAILLAENESNLNQYTIRDSNIELSMFIQGISLSDNDDTLAVISGLKSIHLNTDESIVYRDERVVKQLYSLLDFEEINLATGKKTTSPSPYEMTEEERVEYRTKYKICASGGIITTVDCQIVTAEEWKAGEVLKHVLAFMDEMPPLLNATEPVLVQDGETEMLVLEGDYDIINAFFVKYPQSFDDDKFSSSVIYVRVKNQDGSYRALPVMGHPICIEEAVKKGKNIHFALEVGGLQMDGTGAALENMRISSDKYILEVELVPVEMWLVEMFTFHYYSQFQQSIAEYVQTGNAPEALSYFMTFGLDY
jgi:hypothetical protein